MKASLLLLVALSCVAVALAGAPASPASLLDGAPPHEHGGRVRRYLFGGWDLGSFFDNVAARIHRAAAASAFWVRQLFDWTRSHPAHSTMYRLRFPDGGVGQVTIVELRHGHPHRQDDHHDDHQDNHKGNRSLLWDGKRLVEEQVTGGNLNQSLSRDGKLRIWHGGALRLVPLSALAKYLSHVPAGSRIGVDIHGSSWRKLRIVLHVLGHRGHEDQKKSVSVLVRRLLKAAKKAASHKGPSAASKLHWNGHGLSWDGPQKANARRRQLRVTKNGVSHVIPLAVVSKHLKNIPTGSEISLEVVGKTLKDLRVLLHVVAHGHKQTVSLLVRKLIKEAEAVQHGAPAAPGKVIAHLGGKHPLGGGGSTSTTTTKPVLKVARPGVKQV